MSKNTQLSHRVYISLMILSWPVVAWCVPGISQVTIAVPVPVQDTEVTVVGSSFGVKTQAMPVLYDVTDKAFENGVVNLHQAGFVEGDPVQVLASDPLTIWEKPSNADFPATVTYDSAHRNSHVSAHYVVNGSVGFLGWPVAYDYNAANNQKLYVSWWHKPRHQPLYYWQWDLSNVKGSFIEDDNALQPGEPLTIVTPSEMLYGEVVKVLDSRLYFIAQGVTSPNVIQGATIKGLFSNATAVLTDSSSAFQSPGSSKFIRIWEEQTGKNGLRFSWTQIQTTLIKDDGKALVLNEKVEALKVRDWNHLEIEIDLAKNTYRSWINNILQQDVDITVASRDTVNFSPTIALIGIDGKQDFQKTEFGEIYMDNTLQRIFIGNAPTWSKVTHAEIQLPTSWTDGQVKFNLNLGAFSTGDNRDLYIYVFDGNGEPNPTGVSMCTACKSPPGVITVVK